MSVNRLSMTLRRRVQVGSALIVGRHHAAGPAVALE
jgi:hypothetical protein